MDAGCAECHLAVFLVFSTLTYLAELTFQALLLYHLYQFGNIVWFAACAGLVILSLVATQLVSFQIRTDRQKNCSEKRWIFVVCHVFLMGQLWRYGRLARSCRIPITRREIWEAFAVRLFVSFCCSFPVLCLTTYLIFSDGFQKDIVYRNWPLFACGVSSLTSVVWSLATYSKLGHICCVIGSLPDYGSLMWKLPWRLCDVIARTLSLVVFAVVHGYWILLVLLLHWLTMALLMLLDNNLNDKKSKAKLAFSIFISSYIHIFVRFNTSSGKSRLVLILYNVISCAECITLTVLWLLYDNQKQHHLAVGLTIGIALVGSVLCAFGYYGCLHSKLRDTDFSADNVCYYQCMTCRFEQLGRKSKPYNPSHVTVQENPNPQFCDLLQPSEYTQPSGHTQLGKVKEDLTHQLISELGKTASQPTTSNPVQRAVSFCQTGYVREQNASAGPILCDLSWDDCDMATYSDTTDYSTIHHRAYSVSSQSTDCDCSSSRDRELQEITDKLVPLTKSPIKTKDFGYFSGISSSSSNPNPNTQTKPKHKLPLFPHTCNGFWSDDASSTVTSVSSRVRLMSRDRMYGDTTSLDSFATSTTNTSLYNVEPILDLPRSLRHLYRQRAGPGPRRKLRPKPRKRLQRPHYTNRSYNGDTSSTHAPDIDLESNLNT